MSPRSGDGHRYTVAAGSRLLPLQNRRNRITQDYIAIVDLKLITISPASLNKYPPHTPPAYVEMSKNRNPFANNL